MNASALDLLQSVFGYSSFRGQQQAVVEHLGDGGDALVLMPTGGGKSLCYQIPALLRQGTGIVVSPLIALMQDQVDALREAGVAAAYLNSSLGARGAARGRAPAAGRRAEPALRGAGAAAHAAFPGPAGTHRGGAVRDRRGALRVAVGPRFPPRIPRAGDPAAALSRGAAHRAHRHRRCAHARGDRRAAVAAECAAVRVQFRPAEHRLPGRPAPQRQAPARRFPAGPPGRIRHRLLPQPAQGGRHRRMAGRGRHRGACRITPASMRRPARRTSSASCARTAW